MPPSGDENPQIAPDRPTPERGSHRNTPHGSRCH